MNTLQQLKPTAQEKGGNPPLPQKPQPLSPTQPRLPPAVGGHGQAGHELPPKPLEEHEVPLRMRVAHSLVLRGPSSPRLLRAVEYLVVRTLSKRDATTGTRKLVPEERADALLTWFLAGLPVHPPGLELKEYLTVIEEALGIGSEEAFIEARLLERSRALKYRLGARFMTRGALKAAVQCQVLLERVWCEPGFRRSLPPHERPRFPLEAQVDPQGAGRRRGTAPDPAVSPGDAPVPPVRAHVPPVKQVGTPTTADAPGVRPQNGHPQARTQAPVPPPSQVPAPATAERSSHPEAASVRPKGAGRAPSGQVIVLPAPMPSGPASKPLPAPWSGGALSGEPVLKKVETSERTAIASSKAALVGGLGRPGALRSTGLTSSSLEGEDFELVQERTERAGGLLFPTTPTPARSEKPPSGQGRVGKVLSGVLTGIRRALSSEKEVVPNSATVAPPSVPHAPATPEGEHQGVEEFARSLPAISEEGTFAPAHLRPKPVHAPWALGQWNPARQDDSPEPSSQISERLPDSVRQLAQDGARLRAREGSGPLRFPKAIFPANLREGEGFIADPNPAFREEPPPAPGTAPWELTGVDGDALMRELWALALPGVEPDLPELQTELARSKKAATWRQSPSGGFGWGGKGGQQVDVHEFRPGATSGPLVHPPPARVPHPPPSGADDVEPSLSERVEGIRDPLALSPELAALLDEGLAAVTSSRVPPPAQESRSGSGKLRKAVEVDLGGIEEPDELEALGLRMLRPPPGQGSGESAMADDARSVSIKRARREAGRGEGGGSDPTLRRVELKPLKIGTLKPGEFRASAPSVLPQDSPSHEKVMPTPRTWKTGSPLKALATGFSSEEALAVQSSFDLTAGSSALRRLGARVQRSLKGRGAGAEDAQGGILPRSSRLDESSSGSLRALVLDAVSGAGAANVPLPPWEPSSSSGLPWLVRFRPGRTVKYSAGAAWLCALGLAGHLISEPPIPFIEAPEQFQAYRIDALAGGTPIVAARRLEGTLILTAAPEWSKLKPHENRRLMAHLSRYLIGQDGISAIVVVDLGGRLLAQMPSAAGTSKP